MHKQSPKVISLSVQYRPDAKESRSYGMVVRKKICLRTVFGGEIAAQGRLPPLRQLHISSNDLPVYTSRLLYAVLGGRQTEKDIIALENLSNATEENLAQAEANAFSERLGITICDLVTYLQKISPKERVQKIADVIEKNFESSPSKIIYI